MESQVNNTVAIIKGDCCVRSSGRELDEFVMQEDLERFVTQENLEEATQQWEESLDEAKNEMVQYTNTVSTQSKLYLSAVALAMSQLNSEQIKNPEWDFVIIDAEDKIVMGIKKDTSTVCYLTPEELWRYVFDSITFEEGE